MITGKCMPLYCAGKHIFCFNRSLWPYLVCFFPLFSKAYGSCEKIIGDINLLFMQTILCSVSVVFCLFNYREHLHENRILRLEQLLMLFFPQIHRINHIYCICKLKQLLHCKIPCMLFLHRIINEYLRICCRKIPPTPCPVVLLVDIFNLLTPSCLFPVLLR